MGHMFNASQIKENGKENVFYKAMLTNLMSRLESSQTSSCIQSQKETLMPQYKPMFLHQGYLLLTIMSITSERVIIVQHLITLMLRVRCEN